MIANVVKQSGGQVADWMLAMPKLSKTKKKVLAVHPPERKDLREGERRRKKRKMMKTSKKKKEEEKEEEEEGEEEEEMEDEEAE